MSDDMTAKQHWMQEQQLNTSRTTYKVEGGKKMTEKDLPDQFRRASDKTANPCMREMATVQRCLEKGGGRECEGLLGVYNRCEEKYYTQSRVEAIASASH